MDKTHAIYEVICENHNESYVGETQRPLKQRAYEHYVIDHQAMQKNYSLEQETEPEDPPITSSRRSERISKKPSKNYKNMSTGAHLKLSEGTTEVSKHVATKTNDGDPCNITIKPISYETNWDKRLFKEAIEIKRRKPTLNEDQGKRRIPPIYTTIVPKEQTETPIERLTHGNTVNEAPTQEEDNNNSLPLP